MTAVTFPPAVGGDGSTVSDDNDPGTGLGNGGHRTRFVPALAQIVSIAQFIVAAANGASNAAFTPVRLMTTANDTLSGLAARDGVTPVAGDRVLVRAQTTGSANGPYVAAAGAWTRATDANVSANFVPNKIIAVSEGTTGANSYWFISNTGTITLGTTAITFLDLPSKTKNNIWTVAQTFSGGASFGAAVTVSSTLGMSGGAINEAQGANIASAATISLDAATGNLVDVTGTTTITTITLAAGRERTTRFTGALTLTNGASLILPGVANIVTANGDVAIWRGFPSGVVQCVSYAKAVALPFLASGGTMTGPLAMAGAAVNTAQGADIASATTINLDTATGNLLNITGTATIQAVTLTNGRERWAVAAGAFTLQTGSLTVLPGGVTRVVAVGDLIQFTALNGVQYARIFPIASGPFVIASGLVNTAGDTSVAIPAGPWSRIKLVFVGVTSGANQYAPYIRVNSDSSTSYYYGLNYADTVGNGAQSGSAATGISILQNSVLQAATNSSFVPLNLELEIYNPDDLVNFKTLKMSGSIYKNASSAFGQANVGGVWGSSVAISSVQLLLRNASGASPGTTVVNATGGTWFVVAEIGQ